MSRCFFLGANSPDGFFSYYDHLIDPETANEVYIIKSAPGSGKSSFMRRVAARLESAGHSPQYIQCSSDPSSLDGILFADIGVAFVDGTAPHVIEAKYPYTAERYLHLGVFVDADRVAAIKPDIISATKAYRACYDGAYRCIRAARAIDDDMFRIVFTENARERAARRVPGIIKREVMSGNNVGTETRRFLDGITPDGVVTLSGTVYSLADRVFELEDSYGMGHFLLIALRDAALEAGHDVISCWDPLAPATRVKHLIIPSLKLAFATMPVDDPYRRVRLDAYLDADVLYKNKQKLKFLRRAKNALLSDAVDDLREAKKRHDALEALYNPAVDFDGLYALADEMGDKLAVKYGAVSSQA